MVPAILLTAGLGTRLRPLTCVRTKAAVPVGGVPIVAHLLRWLATAGVVDVVCNLHHLPHTLTRVVGDGGSHGLRVRYSFEPRILGSAGGPKRAAQLLSSTRVLIVNGDMLTNVDVTSLLAAHESSGALVTMATVPNRNPRRYGGLRLDDTHRVVDIVRRNSTEPSFHFVGVQVANVEVFSAVPPDTPWASTGSLYPALMTERPGSVRAFVSDASWHDIGTPLDYWNTTWQHSPSPDVQSGARASIDPTAVVTHSVLWDDVAVGAGARVHGCVVTDGVHIPGNTEWRDSMIRNDRGDPTETEDRRDGLLVSPLRDQS